MAQKDNYQFHNPVLLRQMLDNLKPQAGEIYIDGTFGAGGYSKAILSKANCKICAFDRDPNVKMFADKLKEQFADSFTFIHNKFSQMTMEMENLGINQVDGIILDLGVSSMQFDQMDRGFSFNSQAKLDMRMDCSSSLSAFEVVNNMPESKLAQIIKEFGEEKFYYKIAKKIVEERQKAEITTSLQLAEIIRSVYPNKAKSKKIDPATKTFQAIRIFVNDELEELKKALEASIKLLKKGGRLIVVSFHSLEDSYVKSFLRKHSGYNDRNYSRYHPLPHNVNKKYNFSLPKLSAIKPEKGEISDNIRSRSSRMRVAIKS